MKYKLLNEVNAEYNAVEQILTNRGIPLNEIEHYLNTTDKDINSFNLLNKDSNLQNAYNTLTECMSQKQECLVVVDADCDGFTSSALLINYLYDIEPDWVINYLHYFLHSGKQHGLGDVEIPKNVNLVIVPDAGSNDYEKHQELHDQNINLIILDHHEAEKISSDAIIINNQLSDYPNKNLSGVGITWQFCRYIDFKLDYDYADKYIDLVSLGNIADVMSLRSIETKHLINKGLSMVTNPFFYYLMNQNAFSLVGHKSPVEPGELTSIGVAFYIAPYVNAMVRSGTQEEKKLLFDSMLQFRAFERVASTKRGHKGEVEKLVEQAVRTCINVKNRQTKAQNTGLEYLEGMISKQHLLDNKILMFKCESGSIDKNIAGLIANKFMAKYQRNTCILFKSTAEDGTITWRGSSRGYDRSETDGFKDLCDSSKLVNYAQGHQAAFGLSIPDKNINDFLTFTNEALKNDDGQITYYVDYIYDNKQVNPAHILDIGRLKSLWGQDVAESLILIKGLKITKEMITLMSRDKHPTIKVVLDNGVEILKFKSSEDEYENLYSENGYIEINLIGTCGINEYYGRVTPQVLIKEYEIVDSNEYYF